MTVDLTPTRAQAAHLAKVARHAAPPDLVIKGGTLVNVFTEELLDGWGLVIAGDRIAYVGPEADAYAGDSGEVIDVAGSLLAPGLVDAHTHLNGIWLPEFARAHREAGVTTAVIDAGIVANNLGGAAPMKGLLEETRSAAIRAYVAIAPQRGLDPVQNEKLGSARDWARLLGHDRAVGVGEVNWTTLFAGDPWAEELIGTSVESALGIEAHGAGARAAALNELRALGVTGDHESLSAAEALERARLGFHVSIRPGTEPDGLEPFEDLLGADRPLAEVANFSLITDGATPRQLETLKLLNAIVANAVDAGLSLPRAVRMASSSAARRHGLDRWIGGLGPGMLADLIVIDGVAGLTRPDLVLIGGADAAPDQSLLPPAVAAPISLRGFDRSLLTWPRGTVRAIRVAAPLVTRADRVDPEQVESTNLILAIDRADARRAFRGVVRDYGLRRGAVALTSCWDSRSILAVGQADADLFIAIERVAALGGGAVVVADGETLAEWQAEIGGTFSRAPLDQVAASTAAVDQALTRLGCEWPQPKLTLEVMTGGSIPFLRLTPEGYFDLKSQQIVGLATDDL
jgi:adenine deaminase